MLVAKFNCPVCEAVLMPPAPVPSGKKFKCPKCARVIVVPEPEEDIEEVEEDFEDVEEVRPERQRPRKVRDEDDEEGPARRRAARDVEEYEEERERPKKPRKKAKKKAGGGAGLKIALFAGIGLLLLGGAGVGVYFLVTRVGGNPQARAFDDATAILTGVTDQASAQAARAALVAVGTRLREMHDKQMADLKKGLDHLNRDPAAIQRAFDEAMRNPEKARADAERMENEHRPMKEALARLTKEASRVSKVPGGKELLAAFWEAWGEGGKMMSFAVGMTETAENLNKALGGFQNIRIGMTEKQVTDILGKPFNIDTSRPGLRTLSYINGAIDIKDGKVVKKFP
jgi:hypothetical protein